MTTENKVILEQYTGEINNKIKEIIEKNRHYSNIDNDNTALELQKDLKINDFSLMDHKENNMKKPLTKNE